MHLPVSTTGIVSFISCCVQVLFKTNMKYGINIQSKEKLKRKQYVHSASFINTCTSHCYCTAMTSQFLPATVERKKVWSLDGPSFSLSLSLDFLNSIFHQLLDSVLVNNQCWVKLSSLHQLFKTLRKEYNTVRTLMDIQIESK